MEKNNNGKNNKVRVTIFYVLLFIIIALVVGVVFVLVNNKNTPNNVVENNNGPVNKDANPEDMPSIAGDDNVTKIGEVRLNNSPELKKSKSYDAYVFESIRLESSSTGTILTAKVTAPGISEKTKGKDIKINFYDKDGNLISMMNAYIQQIKPGEAISFRCESTSDLANAYDIKITE